MNCKQIEETLKPKIKICASENFNQNIINKLKKEDQKMKKRVPFYLKVAAAILVLFAASFSLFFFNKNSQSQVSATPVNKILTESIVAFQKNKTMRIVMEVRTLEHDNFALIGTEYGFVHHEIRVDFSSNRWFIEKPGRIALFDGKNQYLYIKNLDYVIKAGANAGFTEWFQIFFTPDKILEIEKERAKKDESNYEIIERETQIVLTVKQKAQGDFTNDYLYNKSVTESDNKRVFYFDKKSSQLEGFELYMVENNSEILVMRTAVVNYNDFSDFRFFSSKIFGRITIKEISDLEPKVDKELKNKTPEEIARIFLEAFSNKDWKTVEKIYPNCGKLFKKQYEKLELISIGTSFKSGKYAGVYVPYAIKLKNGYVKKWNLALRNDNAQKMWEFDGGM